MAIELKKKNWSETVVAIGGWVTIVDEPAILSTVVFHNGAGADSNFGLRLANKYENDEEEAVIVDILQSVVANDSETLDLRSLVVRDDQILQYYAQTATTSHVSVHGVQVIDTDSKLDPSVIDVSCSLRGVSMIRDDNTFFSLGRAQEGQLGSTDYIGNYSPQFLVPDPINYDGKVVKTSQGWDTNFIILDNFQLWSCGDNLVFEAGLPVSQQYAEFTNTGLLAKEVFGVNDWAIAIGVDNVLYGTGIDYGQFGQGATANLNGFTALPALPAGIPVALFGGDNHVLIINDSGDVYAAGDGTAGQLGDGASTTYNVFTLVLSGQNVTKVSAGWQTGIALTSDGRVFTCGDDSLGQCGLNTGGTVATWTQVPNFTGALDVACSDNHSLVVAADGVAYGTGQNDVGQLASAIDIGGQANVFTPIVANIAQCRAGFDFSYYIDTDGKMLSSGEGSWGEQALGKNNGLNINGDTFVLGKHVIKERLE